MIRRGAVAVAMAACALAGCVPSPVAFDRDAGDAAGFDAADAGDAKDADVQGFDDGPAVDVRDGMDVVEAGDDVHDAQDELADASAADDADVGGPCPPQTHRCGGDCRSDFDPNNCGSRCDVACTAGSGGQPGCDGVSCIVACLGNTSPVAATCVQNTTTVAPPRLIYPPSATRVTSVRPRFIWAPEATADGAYLEVCRDEACTEPVMAQVVSRDTLDPALDLPAGATLFWRMRSMVAELAGNTTSPVWEFRTPAAGTTAPTGVGAWGALGNWDHGTHAAVGAPGVSTASGALVLYGTLTENLAAQASGEILGGTADQFGTAVANAGDLDGDGFGDLVVGAPGAHGGDGRVYVYGGTSSSATGLGATPVAVLDGPSALGAFGVALASAGDANGDGYADVIVGAPLVGNDGGAVMVFYGGAGSLSANRSVTLGTSVPGAVLGTSVAGGCDFNGDGYADVAVGAPGPTGQFVRVYFGTPSGLEASTPVELHGATGGRFGATVACAGDVDGSGRPDLIVGDPALETVYLFLNGSVVQGLSADRVLQDSSGGAFGDAVAGVGDVDRDGYDDVAVGSPAAGTMGKVWLFHGSATQLSAAPQVLEGLSTEMRFGATFAQGDDVDGDGYDDLLVGAPAASNSVGMGLVVVYRGGPNGIEVTPAWTLDGEQSSGSQFGVSVALGMPNGFPTGPWRGLGRARSRWPWT